MHPSSYNSKMKSDFDEESPNNTCPNFWEMIWETKSKLVVMLCELAPGFTGCSEYFPINQDQTAQHGNFVIKNISKSHQNATYFIQNDEVFTKTKSIFSQYSF